MIKHSRVSWWPPAHASEDKEENSNQVIKTPLAGDAFCGVPGGLQQLTRGASRCLFSFDAGSFGSPGRVDGNDSTEAVHWQPWAEKREKGVKANHKRLISLSNVHRGVGRDFWQSAISRRRRRSSLSRYWPIWNLERRDGVFYVRSWIQYSVQCRKLRASSRLHLLC